MKNGLKIVLLITVLVSTAAVTALHKYYVSVTQVEYIEEENSLQIISRIFVDDFEKLIRERYDESITLAEADEPEIVESYIERYIKEKFVIQIDGKSVSMNYLGKEYDNDIVYLYIEVTDLKEINTMEIRNEILFEIYEEQQNIIRTKIKGKHKSFILIKENAKGVLNFN